MGPTYIKQNFLSTNNQPSSTSNKTTVLMIQATTPFPQPKRKNKQHDSSFTKQNSFHILIPENNNQQHNNNQQQPTKLKQLNPSIHRTKKNITNTDQDLEH